MKLKNSKHPNLIETLSLAPINIIKELINKHIKKRTRIICNSCHKIQKNININMPLRK